MNKFVVSLLSLSLLSPCLLAEESVSVEEKSSKVFVGVDYFNGESELSVDLSGSLSGSAEMDFDQTGHRLKIGFQERDNFRFQGYFKIEDFDDAFTEKVYGLGADALFIIPTESNFNPYFLLGFSSDFTELEDEGIEYSEDTLNALALKIGVGALVKINKQVEFQVGYDIQYRTWQDIKVIHPVFGTVDIEQEDKSRTFYAGLNFFF